MSAVLGRRALVIGLGASGRAIAELLVRLGVEVRVYDHNPAATGVPDGAKAFLGKGEPPPECFARVDHVVLSPGVPPERTRALARMHAPDASIEGELGLALRMVNARVGGPREANPPWRRVPTVLVTGTNGKSTVTALTGELLRAGGRRPFVGGNLGTPLATMLIDVLDERAKWPDALVLECSSFQLETLPPAGHQVGMVLNITPDHLDRYPTLEAYASTKAAVFESLASRGLALVGDDDLTRRIAPHRNDIRVMRVGDKSGAWIDDDGTGMGPGHTLVVDGEHFDRAQLRLPGRHNSSNALFALAAARHLRVDAESCRHGLASFTGLPHRMVLVRELDGVRWYNDSKATNVASTLASLGGLAERFVLIAGGRGKGDDLGPLGELVRARGRGLVTIGETAEHFHALAQGAVPAEIAGTLVKAVDVARTMAQPGDAVVLAPACASYDQFRSYAHRGDVFTEAVNALRQK
jgi:UDP-N-acetylmuramoylalanine--D-glutamate ligase